MLSNLSAGSFIAEDTTVNFSTYLRSLKENPIKIVRLLAILIVPSAALGWWYYSLAMSVGAVAPLGSATTIQSSQDTLISAPENISESSEGNTSESSSSVSSDRIDVKINSNSSSSSQTGAVEVDGQSIPIPSDGSTHQIIQNDNGKTTIDINVDSDTTGTSKSRSSTNINLDSSSSMDVDIDSKEVQ
ncbi:MAG: hypothetical protein JWM07_545 [Candidatus Saccharibacteria bacterium]|nr:hypothetical protein [Candidatus Saccharibacteria bacterium]